METHTHTHTQADSDKYSIVTFCKNAPIMNHCFQFPPLNYDFVCLYFTRHILPYVLYFFGLLSNGYSPSWIEGHLIHKKQQKDNKIVLTLFCLRVMLFNNSMS